ncbi:MAG: hypothetical protein IT449_00835 [Phycisphaerales bacterium]|nr:hypothetical protein [Phycisphaerales bacterium]
MQDALKQIEAMVDALGPLDRVRLLEYLVPRVADVVLATEAARGDTAAAWREFRRIGERLASASNGESLTEAVCAMRR